MFYQCAFQTVIHLHFVIGDLVFNAVKSLEKFEESKHWRELIYHDENGDAFNVDPAWQNDKEQSLLHVAAEHNPSVDLVRQLATKGCPLDQKDSEGVRWFSWFHTKFEKLKI